MQILSVVSLQIYSLLVNPHISTCYCMSYTIQPSMTDSSVHLPLAE